jgi:hypothetical protein
MTAGDTVLRGVSMLLDRMNAATRGFWQLTIDVSEPEVPDAANLIDEREFSYTVVDLNHRQNGEQATQEFIEKVHTFNKYIRGRNGNFVGSDVLESNVTLDLPKRLFSQIATMGLVQQSDIDTVVSGEDSGQPVILGNDANNTLARLFAITTISTKNTSGRRSIDRSIPSPQKTGGLCQPPQFDKLQLTKSGFRRNAADGAPLAEEFAADEDAREVSRSKNGLNTLSSSTSIFNQASSTNLLILLSEDFFMDIS